MQLLALVERDRRRRFAEIDRLLDSGHLLPSQLLALKSEMLAMIGADKSTSFDAGNRLARINILLKAAPPATIADSEDGFPRTFKEVARQLLSTEVYDMLCRATNARLAEARVNTNETSTSVPVPQNPKPAIKPESKPRPKSAPASKPTVAPLSASVHRLVSSAANRPMKFDPTTLFKEFGRERCIAVWNFLPPEDRPETAAGFRQQLLRLAAENFFDNKK